MKMDRDELEERAAGLLAGEAADADSVEAAFLADETPMQPVDIATDAADEMILAQAQSFVDEYVIPEAGTTLRHEPLDIGAFHAIGFALAEQGFHPRDAEVHVFVPTTRFDELAESDTFESVEIEAETVVHGLHLHDDASVPDDVVIAIHTDAITTALPQDNRPFLIEKPSGVVVLQLPTDGGEKDGQ